MNSFGLLVVGIAVIACAYITLRMRRRLSDYQAKILQLKEKIKTTTAAG
jgi:cbb3-type cytochrome oxidase subunit 3